MAVVINRKATEVLLTTRHSMKPASPAAPAAAGAKPATAVAAGSARSPGAAPTPASSVNVSWFLVWFYPYPGVSILVEVGTKFVLFHKGGHI